MNVSVTAETVEIRKVYQHLGEYTRQSYSSLTMVTSTTVPSLLAVATNLPLVRFLAKQSAKTFLDWLIISDCSLCIVNSLATILYVMLTQMVEDDNLCFSIFLGFYLAICNRLLTLSIVICRYVFVLHSPMVETSGRRRAFQCCILSFTFVTPLLMTAASVYYRDNAYTILSKIYQYHIYSGKYFSVCTH